jgi:tetratricopeptide (TPR) repeat protein
MFNRTQSMWLLLLLAVSLVGGLAYYLGIRDGTRSAVVVETPTFKVPDELNAELDRIQAAEKIEDPYERCMAYPNPVEFNWSPNVIEAMCKRLSRRMLGWKEIEDALKLKHPETIDQAFDSYLARNEAGEHGYLTWAFWWMFQSSSKWADDTTNHWVRADPQSAYALAARGIHYSEAAYDARGGKFAGDTPEENFARMHELVDKARADLQASLKLNPRLIAAYHGLLRTTRLGDSADEDEQRDAWVEQALAIDPADQWIYHDWIDAVEPQWGGSLREMEQVAERAGEHTDANPTLALLKAEPLCQQANAVRCTDCEKDGQKALDLFRQAGTIGPAECFLDGAGAAAGLAQDLPTATRYYSQAYRFLGKDEWLAYRAQNLRSLGRGAWALENLQNALARQPQNTTLLHALALAYADAGRMGDVEKTYLEMLRIDPANTTAALDLSRLYVTGLKAPGKARPLVEGLLKRDPASAQAWFAMTMLCEAEDDRSCYRDAAGKFLVYANRSDPWQRANVESVNAKLAEIGSAPEE